MDDSDEYDYDLNCTVCEEQYTNDRIPRILDCGHTFCTDCLEQIFHLDQKCPDCRRSIYGNNASELLVNHTVLKLSLSLVSLQIKGEVPNASAPLASEVLVDDKCKVHGSPLFFMCMKCHVRVCRDCLVLDHLEPPRGQCRIVSAKDGLENMKKSHKMTIGLTQYPQKAKMMKEILDQEAAILNSIESSLRAKLQMLQSEIDEANEDLQQLQPQKARLTSSAAQLRKVTDKMQQSEASVNQATTIKELETAMEVVVDTQTNFNKYELEEKERGPIIQRILLKTNQNLLTLLKGGKSVFAILENNGGKRYSSVVFRDNQVLLYSLRDDHPPSGSEIIPFDSVRQMIPKDSPSVFMEVGWKDQVRGRVYIRMFGDTPRSRQCIFLCSGERGPSYRETVFYSYDYKWNGNYNLLRGGDYEKNNGSGGRAIVEDITNSGIYQHPIVAGLMISWPANETWHLGSFNFYLNASPNNADQSAFGRVTKGLEKLLNAAKVKPITDAYVMDCGLVIPIC